MAEEIPSDIEKKLKELEEKEQAVARKLDKGVWFVITSSLSVFMVLFYLYNTGVSPAPAEYHRGIYVLITFVLVFLFYPGSKWGPKDRPSVIDIILSLTAAFVVIYWIREFAALNYRMGMETTTDYYVSVVGVLICLEVARRVLGWTLPIVGACFLLYCYFGPYMPDAIAHRGFSFERIMTHVYLKQEGVFGIMASVLVTYVILFIFFGSFLKKSGAGQFFLDLPMALWGKSIGGPAKVSVVASGFFGSVSGSAIANTATTGTFTIPLMKKAGFKPHVAGGIEPAASVGGMFMPPIMGAGGFIMAELTNTPYVEIMKMAIFPALLYFTSVLVMVHFEAKRHGLRGIDDPEAPTAKMIFKKSWFMVLPLLFIIIFMLIGFSPGFAAVVATVSCVVVSWLTKDHRMGPKQVWEALLDGAKATLVIGSTVGVIGIIVGSIALTGIGLRFSDLIFSLSGGILPVAILLVAIASLVLGMGVPVTAAYLIVAVLVVPVMSSMLAFHHYGAMSLAELTPQAATWTLIASHMLVYWFSQNSNNTPPVCLAAYTGAAIAGADPWKTGWTACNFAKVLYVVPFLFVYSPPLLLNGAPYEIVMVYLTTFLGVIAFSTVSMGYFLCPTNIPEWLVGVLGTILLLFPRLLPGLTGLEIPVRIVDVIAIGLFIAVYMMQKIRIKANPSLTLPLEERRKLKQEALAV